ncbi:MAG: hypothetical protein R3C03_09350 [Pirellulaceae bacterium]
MSLSKAITIAEKGMSFDIVRKSGLFPPIDVLNSFFECGVDDADSEITIEWEPFLIGYGPIFGICRVLREINWQTSN